MYADVGYYLAQYHGEAMSDNNTIGKLLSLAEIKVDEVTFNRIGAIGFANLTEFQQEKIRQAVCRQADYISENGYDDAGIQSFSILDISITAKQGTKAYERAGMCPVAFALLRQTGLMNRGL